MFKKRFSFLISFLIVGSILVITYSIVNIFKWNEDNIETDIEIEEIENITNNSKSDINFEELINKNSDTKGWIIVEGTNINYPFVQYKNNDYYLNHSFNKKYTDAGWIFLEYRNDINNLSKNNIIYGHARLNKTMFGTLKNVLKKSWYKNNDNHIIKIYTEKETLYWQVFSTYSIKTESYYITTDFNNDEDFIKFINTIKSRSKYNYDIDINQNDKILTLSTCHNKNEKIVVHAKLIKNEG